MAMNLGALMPARIVMDAWNRLADIQAWAKLDDAVLKTILTGLGEPDCDSIPLLSSVSQTC